MALIKPLWRAPTRINKVQQNSRERTWHWRIYRRRRSSRSSTTHIWRSPASSSGWSRESSWRLASITAILTLLNPWIPGNVKKKEFFENPLEDLFTRKHLTSTIWHEIKMDGSIIYIFNDINPKTSNLIILKEAIIKKKRIFRRTNST